MTQFNFGCHHKFVYSNGVVLCERCGQFPSKGTGTFDGIPGPPPPPATPAVLPRKERGLR